MRGLSQRLGSFRQLLLVAFLLIAALLGGTALRAVVMLDSLMAQNSEGAARALQLSAAAQSLAERSTAMERAARQSLILSDALLRQRFDEEARNARGVLDQLVANDLPAAQTLRWRAQLAAIGDLMNGPPDTALERERAMAQEFRELDALSARIAQQVQGIIENQNKALLARLDASRDRLTQQVMVSIALSVVLAVGLGLWLARPFGRLEKAIVGLGENRLQEPIDIKGPSDVRGVSQQLEWLRLRLTELDADKSRFLRHISHELKTPLAALREGVALLEDGVTGELNDSQREVARILQQNTRALQNQIEALLRFNAAAFDARQLRRQPTDLLALLEEQVDTQRLQWQAHGLTVQVEGAPLVLPVDREKIGMAVANLLSNAIRFSPHGGTVRLALAALPGRARLDISDQGAGVAEADRGRIFEPFYRGERQPPDAVRGSGIGLSIVQEYIAAHGGRITLLPGEAGAHFRIELPHAS
ncbi:sensor histidine kinase [Variovorax terrae]|uniref:histidine kinase n=1 Tax=Variovorax terrae TaxID=2923278 RepID=A0A9X1VU14_9BURK|nr:ATP-binding protein [Variovorax terrae]MCJ0762029.1 ATP-binding protein [Variovorax terrae]